MLLSAYRQGVFPWFNPGDPILWWNPDPRYVLEPDGVHVSSSMRRVLNRRVFDITADTAFVPVIQACATARRKGQKGTWITEDMELAYRRLHEMGYAHSVECWAEGELVGGLYGVSLGRVFFGESMFSHTTNASKAALIYLARYLLSQRFELIDVQLHTPHLESMGAHSIPRAQFVQLVRRATRSDRPAGPWTLSFARKMQTGAANESPAQ